MLRSNHQPPAGDWNHWYLRSGRGSGKTYAAANYAVDRGHADKDLQVLVLSETVSMAVNVADEMVKRGCAFRPSVPMLEIGNGSTAYFAGIRRRKATPDELKHDGHPERFDVFERIQGMRFDVIVCDEIPDFVALHSHRLLWHALKDGGRIVSTASVHIDRKLDAALVAIPGTVVTGSWVD